MGEKQKKKKIKIPLVLILLIVLVIIAGTTCAILLNNSGKKNNNNTSAQAQEDNNLPKLPPPEVTGGDRGKLGIDKNINESNIDEYLNRPDSVYRDMRMLDDPGNYEAIGGDSKISGYVKGFEVVPLPYLIPVTGLPDEVGDTYTGKTLFYKDEDGNYKPNYEESLSMIEQLFPKNKVIFLMCGGGGYAGMTKEFLVSLGWDANKIYNVGGYWYYDGQNNVEVKKEVDGKIKYDFSIVPYHDIKFDELTFKVNSKKTTLDKKNYGKTISEYYDNELNLEKALGYNMDNPEERKKGEEFIKNTIQKKVDIIEDLIEKESSFVVVTFNEEGSCYGEPGEHDFDLGVSAVKILNDSDIYAYRINLPMFKKTSFYPTVKYAPSIIVFNKGEIAAYTDANSDSFDSDKDVKEWLHKYVDFKD